MRASSLLLVLAACGGGDSGEPLVSGSMTASYDGHEFTPVNGFATLYNDRALIAVGEGSIGCGSEDDANPPSGYNAVMALSAFTVGSHSNVSVQLYKNDGGFESVGSSVGTVVIEAVTTEVTGTVAFSLTHNGRMFALSGSFGVKNCMP